MNSYLLGIGIGLVLINVIYFNVSMWEGAY